MEKNGFTELKRAYENAYLRGAYGDELGELALFITHSVLKKLHAVSGDKVIYRLQNELNRGDQGDAMDIKQDIALALIDESKKAVARGARLEFLDEPFEKRTLSKRVYIQRENSAEYKIITTTPIQQVFRCGYQSIRKQNAVRSASNKFVYIDEFDEDTAERLYTRLPKYSTLGNDTPIDELRGGDVVTADTNDYQQMLTLIDKMELTPVQSQVLDLRMRGYGLRAIATYRGVSPQAVAGCLQGVRKKAQKIGLNPKGCE